MNVNFIQETAVTDMQDANTSEYKEELIYLRFSVTKEEAQIYFTILFSLFLSFSVLPHTKDYLSR
jgi:hypothetical protein